MIDHALALTHIDERGAARMVDVSEKPVTLRVAKASGLVIMKPSTLRMISDGAAAKGDVMAAARIAGIAAAKRTGDLIPLCHPLGLDAVSVTITPCEPDRVKILATTTTLGRTGVEMEALTAVSVRLDYLRHVQSRRSSHGDFSDRAPREKRRPVRSLSPKCF